MSFRWSVTPTQAFVPGAAAYVAAIRRGVRAIADRWSITLEAEMKSNAPWQDQTGNLRQALYTEVEQVSLDMVEIILSHGLNYGIWLETKFAARDAVIAPTIDAHAPRIWADVVAMLS